MSCSERKEHFALFQVNPTNEKKRLLLLSPVISVSIIFAEPFNRLSCPIQQSVLF